MILIHRICEILLTHTIKNEQSFLERDCVLARLSLALAQTLLPGVAPRNYKRRQEVTKHTETSQPENSLKIKAEILQLTLQMSVNSVYLLLPFFFKNKGELCGGLGGLSLWCHPNPPGGSWPP